MVTKLVYLFYLRLGMSDSSQSTDEFQSRKTNFPKRFQTRQRYVTTLTRRARERTLSFSNSWNRNPKALAIVVNWPSDGGEDFTNAQDDSTRKKKKAKKMMVAGKGLKV